jgi:hypothetical protein
MPEPEGGLILQRAAVLRAAGMNSNEIAAKVPKEAEVSPGLVEFIIG